MRRSPRSCEVWTSKQCQPVNKIVCPNTGDPRLVSEATVLEQRISLRLDVSNLSELLNEAAERMERCYGPPLDARDKQRVDVLVGRVEEALGCLVGWDGDERDTLVDRLEPDDFGAERRIGATDINAISLSALGVCPT